MAEERNEWVDAVAKMIQLTKQGKMRWDAGFAPDPSADKSDKEKSAAFYTLYKGRKLRLYDKLVRLNERQSALAAMTTSLLSDAPKYRTVVVLEFMADNGVSLWRFPAVDALSDLLAAVRYQVAGVKEFLKDIQADMERELYPSDGDRYWRVKLPIDGIEFQTSGGGLRAKLTNFPGASVQGGEPILYDLTFVNESDIAQRHLRLWIYQTEWATHSEQNIVSGVKMAIANWLNNVEGDAEVRFDPSSGFVAYP